MGGREWERGSGRGLRRSEGAEVEGLGGRGTRPGSGLREREWEGVG